MDKPLIYITGPVSRGRNAVNAAENVYQAGGIPFVPQFWEFITPHEHGFWMELCLKVVPRFDGIYRLHGPSLGSDLEVERARLHGLAVFIENSDPAHAHLSTVGETLAEFINRSRALKVITTGDEGGH